MAYRFNRDRQRYETDSGRAIASTRVRGWIDSAVDKTKAALVGLAERLITGSSNLSEFVTEARQQLKSMHSGLGMIAVGGKEQLTASDRGRLGAALREQYQYLDRLALQIESGQQRLDGSLLSRVSMYADAGVHTYERMRQQAHTDAGFTQERNLLGSENSCSQCPEETARGWSPIGSLTPTGARECLTRCRCHLEYR